VEGQLASCNSRKDKSRSWPKGLLPRLKRFWCRYKVQFHTRQDDYIFLFVNSLLWHRPSMSLGSSIPILVLTALVSAVPLFLIYLVAVIIYGESLPAFAAFLFLIGGISFLFWIKPVLSFVERMRIHYMDRFFLRHLEDDGDEERVLRRQYHAYELEMLPLSLNEVKMLRRKKVIYPSVSKRAYYLTRWGWMYIHRYFKDE